MRVRLDAINWMWAADIVGLLRRCDVRGCTSSRHAKVRAVAMPVKEKAGGPMGGIIAYRKTDGTTAIDISPGLAARFHQETAVSH
jgi:hypothetical protein